MSDYAGTYTLSNRGQARNCTLTTLLFPANFQILSSAMGGIGSGEESEDAPVRETD